MILIKKETAHQLPALGISQRGTVNLDICTSVSHTLLLIVSVPFERENENIFSRLYFIEISLDIKLPSMSYKFTSKQ